MYQFGHNLISSDLFIRGNYFLLRYRGQDLSPTSLAFSPPADSDDTRQRYSLLPCHSSTTAFLPFTFLYESIVFFDLRGKAKGKTLIQRRFHACTAQHHITPSLVPDSLL